MNIDANDILLKSIFRSSPIVWAIVGSLIFIATGFYLNGGTFQFNFLSIIFIGIGISFWLWFFTLKKTYITNNSFVMKWIWLPRQLHIHFDEVDRVSYDELVYEGSTGTYRTSTYTIYRGQQLLIHLKSGKIIKWTTYEYSNYEDLVKTLRRARKRYKAAIAKRRRNN